MASDEFQQLGAAVAANDAAAVASLLQRNPHLKARLNDPLPTESFGTVALQVAVRRANRAMLDVLLDAGANINQRSHWWAGGFGVLDNDGGNWLRLSSAGPWSTPYAAPLDWACSSALKHPHRRRSGGRAYARRRRADAAPRGVEHRDRGVAAGPRRRHQRPRYRPRIDAGPVSAPRSAACDEVSGLARLPHRHPARRGARRLRCRRAASRREPVCRPHERGRDVVPDEEPSCRRQHLHLDARRQENGAHDRPGVRPRRRRASAVEGQRRVAEPDDGVRARRRRPGALADFNASRARAGASAG